MRGVADRIRGTRVHGGGRRKDNGSAHNYCFVGLQELGGSELLKSLLTEAVVVHRCTYYAPLETLN